jgi:predicted RNA binding protein YcfA (HicA-like mRNA interferase family)
VLAMASSPLRTFVRNLFVDEQRRKTRREDPKRQIRSELAFDDLCYILERAGFVSRPGKGSHRIYSKDGVVEIINIQPRNRKAKPYQVKQVRELLLKYKIVLE